MPESAEDPFQSQSQLGSDPTLPKAAVGGARSITYQTVLFGQAPLVSWGLLGRPRQLRGPSNFLANSVYSIINILGLAIGLSQLRHRNRRIKRNSLRTRVLAPISVLTFYCVLSIFDDPDRSMPAVAYFRFVLHLVPGL